MTQLLNDTFTAANGTSITAHTPDSGGSWSLHMSSGGAGTIQSNRAAGTGTGNYAYYFHSVDATVDGEAVTQNLSLLPSVAGNSGLMLRCKTASSGSFYMCYWNHTTGEISFWRKNSGTLTQIAAAAGTQANGSVDHVMEFRVSGTGASIALECLFDGVSKATYSDTSGSRLTTLGAAGFIVSGASTAVGYHVDSITATDSAVPPATATTLSGPSTGAVGVASTNFTAGANGVITGTITITPSDGGGGTFTPTSVAISSGTPTATFTYTPASAGAKTISISDDGGLTDATPLTYTATSSNAIAISTPANRRTHQRSGTTGTISVTGTYTGATSIEARLVQHGTNTPLSGFDWSTKVASPSGGAYSFSFASVPQGGWYNVQVRLGNDTGTSATSGKVGVGVQYAFAGQSNAWLQFRSRSTATTPNDLVSTYGNIGTWAAPDTANMSGAIAFGNAMASALGIPVALLDYAKDSGAISFWVPVTNAQNRNFTNAVAALDGKIEAAIWIQGENDADSARTQAQYYADLGTLFADWRTQFSQASLPIILPTLGNATSGLYNDAETQAIIDAQIQKCDDANHYRVDRRDLPLLDTVHPTAAGFATLGARIAHVAKYLAGAASFYRGPSIASATSGTSTTVDVTLTHRGGTDITPSSAITGFRLTDASGNVPISSAARVAANSIRLSLGRAIAATPVLDYMYGVNPEVTGAVADNSTATLPLESKTAVSVAASTVTGVSVSPSTATVPATATQQFTATVAGTGSPSQAVTWATVGGGSISGLGLFTAPAATGSPQTITVTATSAQDGAYSGSATVTVPAGPLIPSGYAADLATIYADFGQTVTHHPAAGGADTVGLAILDEPGTVLLGGEQLATDYGLRYPAYIFPSIKRADTITIGAVTYTARETAQPIGIDGLEHVVPLARAS